MKQWQFTLYATIMSCLSVACGEETNPYRDRYEKGNLAKGTGDVVAAQPGSAGQGTVAPPKAEDLAKPAPPDSIKKEAQNSLQLICSNPPALAKFQAEMGVLCVGGQPTKVFADALAAPFKGGAVAPIVPIKIEDKGDGSSEFILLAVIEVAKPFAQANEKRSLLKTGTVTANGNSTTRSIRAERAPAGSNDLGGADVLFTAKISIVTRVTLQEENNMYLDPEKTIVATTSNLKAGAPENAQAITANSLSFFMAEGNVTKIISVNHQVAKNSGQHNLAARSVQEIGKATMIDVFTKISQ